ncbi:MULTISPECIES: thymidine kinase [Pseudidiomarina]|nr:MULTISPECIES: thymidine kinase [Pseudidiomarina]MDT7525867.1 thymidine kinase [Pseudidiomarina sp. GXY010]MDX1526582.1 thymidine kinase [Pseudidiomarina maritima]
MASLYFTYSAMNAGKSTSLLQVAYNYEERDQRVLLLTPSIDDRAGAGTIASRLGIERSALGFSNSTDLAALIEARHAKQAIDCVLIDEAQFLTEAQVWQLTDVVDRVDIPVMCYGIRSDAFGQAFPGSAVLLAVADKLAEMKTICFCGRKATMNLRIDEHGNAVTKGDQIAIGGNDRYISCCRKHWKEKLNK